MGLVSMTVEQSFTIVNSLGLHARAAASFVNLANKFESEILVELQGQEVNGKSIMGLLILAAAPGMVLTIKARGEDASRAMASLGELISAGFHEES